MNLVLIGYRGTGKSTIGREVAERLGMPYVSFDEEIVRRLTSDLLERMGYEVLEAVDGQDGVDVFAENRDRIQLVLLDLTMPRKSGDEVYEEIQGMAPETPVLFSSGFAENEAIKRFGHEDWVGFIQKPYRPQELEDVLAELLRIPVAS